MSVKPGHLPFKRTLIHLQSYLVLSSHYLLLGTSLRMLAMLLSIVKYLVDFFVSTNVIIYTFLVGTQFPGKPVR